MLRWEELIRGKEKLLIETNTTIPQLKILRTPSRSLGIISKNSTLKLFGFKEPRIGLNKLYIKKKGQFPD